MLETDGDFSELQAYIDNMFVTGELVFTPDGRVLLYGVGVDTLPDDDGDELW